MSVQRTLVNILFVVSIIIMLFSGSCSAVAGTRQSTFKAREHEPRPKAPVKAQQTAPKTAQKVVLNGEAIPGALERPIDLDLSRERAFSAALDELRSSSKNGLNLIVLWRDLDRIGIDRDTPIQIGPIEAVPLRTALRLLLNAVTGEDGLLDYRLLDGAVVIATKPTLAKFGPETRVLDVTDLIALPAEYRTEPRGN